MILSKAEKKALRFAYLDREYTSAQSIAKPKSSFLNMTAASTILKDVYSEIQYGNTYSERLLLKELRGFRQRQSDRAGRNEYVKLADVARERGVEGRPRGIHTLFYQDHPFFAVLPKEAP